MNKKCSFGRSMMEMLGVLAIIGLLTIGALVGFKEAQHKITQNTVLKEAMQQGVALRLRRNLVSTDGEVKYLDKSEYIVSRTVDAENRTLILTTKELAPEICESLLSSANTGIFSEVTCSETNALSFALSTLSALSYL